MRADGPIGMRGVVLERSGLPMDGAAVLDRVIADLAPRAKDGKCAIVWDIDGTLLDTRPRMLAAIHAYGRTDVTLDQLTTAAPHTDDVAAQFGLDPVRFHAVWRRVFWTGLERDHSIKPIIDRLRRAHRLGIKVIIYTGRHVEIHADTSADLRRRGIPFDTLMCKLPNQDTPVTKAERIENLLRANIEVGAFVTDCTEEVSAVAKRLPKSKMRFILVAGRSETLEPARGLRAHVFPVVLRQSISSQRQVFA